MNQHDGQAGSVPNPRPQTGAWTGVLFGLAVAALGVAPLLALWYDPSGARAPVWVIETACGAFIVAGFSFIFESVGQRLVARLLSAMLIPLLAVTALWALFDTGGTCTISSGLFGISVGGTAPDWPCRAAFGGGVAAMLLAALGVALAVHLRRRRTRAALEQQLSSNQTG